MNRTAVTTLLCGFATVGLLSAGTASAATTAERAYLKALDDTYQTAYQEDAKAGTGKDADALIKAGHRSCEYIKDQVAKGLYTAEKADKALKWDPEVYVTEGETTLIREAALDKLCPNAVKSGIPDAQGTADAQDEKGAKGDGDKSANAATSDKGSQSDTSARVDHRSTSTDGTSGKESAESKKDTDSTSGKGGAASKDAAPKKDESTAQDGRSGKTKPKTPAGSGGMFGTGSAGH